MPADVVTPPVATPNGVDPSAVPVEPPKPAEDPRLSKRFEDLVRQDRALVQKQLEWRQKMEAEKAALEKEKAAIETAKRETEGWKNKIGVAKEKPSDFLREIYGEDWYDQLTQYKLSQEKEIPPEMRVQQVRDQILSEVQKMKEEQEALKRQLLEEKEQMLQAEKERAERENAAAMERFEKEAVDFVKGNASKYELTTLFGREDLIPKTIREAYQATANTEKPRIMSYQEAADEVEKFLSETVGKYETWKQKKVAPQDAAPPATSNPSAPAPTLSNSMTASPSIPSTGAPRKMSESDRIKRALEAWEKAATKR